MSRAPDAHGDIDEFLAFMAGQGAANLIVGRRGAGAEAIARFAALAPFPLPSLLLGYLREFGEHADGVVLGGDGRELTLRGALSRRTGPG